MEREKKNKQAQKDATKAEAKINIWRKRCHIENCL